MGKYHASVIEGAQNMLKLIEAYEGIQGSEEMKDNVFLTTFGMVGYSCEKANEYLKIVKKIIPMKEQYISIINQ
jgi:hypothetical protein